MRPPPSKQALPITTPDRSHYEKISKLKSLQPPAEIPDYVLADVVRLPSVEQSYHDLQVERDRRLRLLVRRYVNQIQFGCRNHNCNVATCLSYRKRNTKTPLRRYTELSARTTACRLVDDFQRQGKDPGSGLCCNEPVVPWYQDPGVCERRRSVLSDEQRDWEKRTKASSSHQRQSSRSDVDTVDQGRHASNGAVVSSNLSKGTTHVNGTCVTLQPPQQSDLDTDPVSDKEPRPSGPQILNPAHTSFTTSTSTDHDRPAETADADVIPVAQKQDLSSFTQRVWDALPLRMLGRQMARTSDEDAQTNASAIPALQSDDLKTELEAAPTTESEPSLSKHQATYQNTAFCGLVFHNLSWHTLRWLFVHQYRSISPWSISFETFLQQGIFHVLSNPIRLLESAQDWGRGPPITTGGPCKLNTSAIDDDDEESALKHLYESRTQKKAAQKVDLPKSTEVDPNTNVMDASRIAFAFSALNHISGSPGVFDALNRMLNQCYQFDDSHQSIIAQPRTPTTETSISLSFKPRLRLDSLAGDKVEDIILTDSQITDVFLITMLAATTTLWKGNLSWLSRDASILENTSAKNYNGNAYPASFYNSNMSEADRKACTKFNDARITTVDELDDARFTHLLATFMDCISHRNAGLYLFSSKRRLNNSKSRSYSISDMFVQKLYDSTEGPAAKDHSMPLFLVSAIIELIRNLLRRMWDREAIISRTGPVGGALQLLSSLYRQKADFGINASYFVMNFMTEPFDEMEMPCKWLSFRPSGQHMHILSCSFLFEPAILVKYFRAINIQVMRKSHEQASIVYNDARQYLGSIQIPVYGAKEVLTEMRPHMARYFVLTIRRSHILTDAINQIWRRQRRELLRPLRVRLGKDEGEDGLDHGGVQQEFFRLVLGEVLQPEYGMFIVDDRTRMTWFQPGSMEPLYKFEAIGVLMSLAIYNAVTLPVTFPLAFYRKLLQLKVKKLEHIADGWPDLAKGFRFLLEWSDGDVGDVIARTYEFSYNFAGTSTTIDMQKVGRDDMWPPIDRQGRRSKEKAKSASFELPKTLDITPPSHSPPLASSKLMKELSRASSFRGVSTPVSIESEAFEEAETVTNANREQYMKDYVFWLTDKSIRPQYEAFSKGFFSCLDPTALTIFTPEALKRVVEGHTDIDIDELEETASYDEYEKSSRTVIDFWEVVRDFSTDQHRQLLEFVTASDRVPVNGIKSIQFIVQKNGEDDMRLPSSSTCYGRLLLPQYSTKEILREKLTKAIENSMGFGAL